MELADFTAGDLQALDGDAAKELQEIEDLKNRRRTAADALEKSRERDSAAVIKDGVKSPADPVGLRLSEQPKQAPVATIVDKVNK